MGKKKPVLSIIIVSFNTRKLTKECLRSVISSLKETNISYEVIVVDNASTDKSIEEIKKSFPKIRLFVNKENKGYGAANNQGIKRANGELVLLLNSDIVVLNNAISKLVDYYTVGKNIDFLGGKLLNPDKTPQASCGPFLSLPVVFMMLFTKGEQLGITRYSPNKAKEVDWISGACILCRKKDFLSLEGFDEDIFLYMEEIELFYRAKKMRMKVFFYPDAKFIHLGSASSKEWKTPIMNLYKGLIYFYKKHKDPASVLVLRAFLAAKAFIGIIVGWLLGRKSIYEAYKEGLRVSFS